MIGPLSHGFTPELVRVLAIGIFLLTYLGVAMGRLPLFRLDRTGVAFVGGVLMVACGALTIRQAIGGIDFNTIALLLGMMILAAALRRAGFFYLVTNFALKRAAHPLALLASVVVVSGVLSAVLVNDTICVVLTPLVLDIVIAAGAAPMPYLIALAASSNIGSVATITGNPQNIIIGSFSGISYARFSSALVPVALAGLVLVVAVVALVWRGRLRDGAAQGQELAEMPVHPRLIVKALVLLGFFVAACLAGMVPAEAALIAAALLLLTPGLKSETLLAGVDWSLLLMFAGLFVVVAGLQREVITPALVQRIAALHPGRPAVLVPVTAVLSNIVSNVPAVLVLKPFIAALADPKRAWLMVAMAATFAGNFTLLGSVANLIVAERARARGIPLTFSDFLCAGIPITLISLVFGTLWLIYAG
ncbi:anion transporter [Acidiphilium sp. AL]|uniref:Anion transporter n=2 Tax=Acidiphilium TaxID=522 RepID=A0ABS9DYH5_9PROT|nr:SLC13 family permease [Acidiphilium iwatense]MCF3946855.1 anion transporter [Acidiphilium iwatense]MCU4161040.1 anion transporter [Acidiphilium sp. AL]